ncbi:hypothetical protein K402DRAFT_339184, partial [Aulographum hederae CBS 113979]
MDPPTPKRKSKHLSRDQRLQIQSLYKAGLELKQIHDHLGFSYRQIWHTCHASRPTPKKRSGRPLTLSDEQVDEIEIFIISKRSHRLLSYEKLA